MIANIGGFESRDLKQLSYSLIHTYVSIAFIYEYIIIQYILYTLWNFGCFFPSDSNIYDITFVNFNGLLFKLLQYVKHTR